MAITIIGKPTDNHNPTYNPIVYYFDSTNKNEDGYRYIAQVKDQSNNLLFEKKLIPDFDDKKGVLHINRELADFVDYDLDFNNLDANGYPASNSFKRYKIEVGEEYIETWDWFDYGFGGTGIWSNVGNPVINPNGLARTMLFNQTSTTPPYNSGDVINVTLTTGVQDKPEIGGIHKVLDIEFVNDIINGVYIGWIVVLELPWVGSGNSDGGSTAYADGRKTRFLGLNNTLSGESVFNGVFSTEGWLDYDMDNFVMSGSNKDFLSQIYDEYRVRRDNTIFINYMKNELSSPTTIVFENNDGDISSVDLHTDTDDWVCGIDVSPTRSNWGTLISGTLPIIKPNTEWYSFKLVDTISGDVSKEIKIFLDDSCVGYTPIEMLWLDKLGSFLPWNFTLRNVESQTMDKKDYTKYLGGYDGTKYSYELEDGGNITYNKDYEREFLLRTDFLTEQQSTFFQNVLHSPVTMIKIDGKFHRCVILDTSIEIKGEKWFELRRYEIRVTLSNNNKINI